MNLLAGLGQSQPVTGFIDSALKFQQGQDQSAFRKQEVQNLEERRKLMEQARLQEEKDYKEYHVDGVASMYPEHIRPLVAKALQMGGVVSPEGITIGKEARNVPKYLKDFGFVPMIYQAEIDRMLKENEKFTKSGDPEGQQKSLENASQIAIYKKLLAKEVGDKQASGFTLSEGQKRFDAEGNEIADVPKPEDATRGVDPSIVRTFEAAHPELVSKKGTTEYGQALEAFIKAGERPYTTFVGLTPDGTQAITFDSRKGTVGLQPLPFKGEIQPKIKPTVPTGEATAFQQIGTLKEALSQVTDNYEDSFVGPVAGPAGKIQDNWGVMPDAKRAEFRALTANLYNTIIYLRSGKQINEEEAKRLLDELPTMNISPVAFQAKLKKFTWELNSIERGKMRQLKGAGYRNVPEAQGAPPPASSKPRFEIIGVN